MLRRTFLSALAAIAAVPKVLTAKSPAVDLYSSPREYRFVRDVATAEAIADEQVRAYAMRSPSGMNAWTRATATPVRLPADGLITSASINGRAVSFPPQPVRHGDRVFVDEGPDGTPVVRIER